MELIGKEDFFETVAILNECVIRGVSEEIWKKTKTEVMETTSVLGADDYAPFEKTAEERLSALIPSADGFSKETVEFFGKSIFPKYSLWYFQYALEPFGAEGARKIAEIAKRRIEESGADVRHLNFLPLSEEIHYDRDGRKYVNVYKQRVIEKWLSDPCGFGEHVRPKIEIRDSFALVSFEFAPACAKLTEFCVEAERSGLLAYERSVTTIYDMFGFRRDGFDRLANEEKYLETMNASSGKARILDWVKGDSIVDVGSGGGVLLRKLERRFPNAKITGTDVSENVLGALAKEKKEEGKRKKVGTDSARPLPKSASGKDGLRRVLVNSSRNPESVKFSNATFAKPL